MHLRTMPQVISHRVQTNFLFENCVLVKTQPTTERAQEAQTIDTYIAMRIFKFLFQVTHKIDQKIMVLKRNKHRANRSSMLKEVQLMNTLNHENILK